MKLKLLVFVLLALLVFPAWAQDSAAHTVNFDGFGFSFDSSIATHINIMQVTEDQTDSGDMGVPEAPHTRFTLYNESPPPEFGAPGEIRIYNTADFADYEPASQQLQQLQSLLTERADLTPFMDFGSGTPENTLPFMPIQNANQVIRPRAQYVDTGAVTGISYVTVFRQDVSPFVGNEFRYTFQGISMDGTYYIAAAFLVDTALFPAEIPSDFDWDTFNEEFEQYLSESVLTLNNAAPQDFTPTLTTFDALIQSLILPAFTPSAPEVTETPTGNTSALGGLRGTWALVSYGSPEAPQPALETPPATLIFSDEGVGGNASCNQYSATFQYSSGEIAFSDIISTLMACTDENVMAQEDAFLAALQSATSYAISGGQLQIFYDDGILTFTASEDTRSS